MNSPRNEKKEESKLFLPAFGCAAWRSVGVRGANTTFQQECFNSVFSVACGNHSLTEIICLIF